MIKRPYMAHESAVIDGENDLNGYIDPQIGAGTKIWHFCHVSAGAKIGSNCVLGQNVFVASTAVIGNGCKIQNNVSVYDGVELEDHVFCGPSMVFTNLSNPLPRAAISRRQLFAKTVVRRHASIGAGAVIICGHELGESCFVAAGSVVTKDVPAYALVAGNPARLMGWVCQCGARLSFQSNTAKCEDCGAKYQQVSSEKITQV